MKNLLLALIVLTVSCAKQNPVVSGTFEGTAPGRNADIIVSVTLTDTVITEISVISSEETAEMADPVYTSMLQAMIDNNNTNIDSISGATLTSVGFKKAVEAALASAGVNLKGKKIKV